MNEIDEGENKQTICKKRKERLKIIEWNDERQRKKCRMKIKGKKIKKKIENMTEIWQKKKRRRAKKEKATENMNEGKIREKVTKRELCRKNQRQLEKRN